MSESKRYGSALITQTESRAMLIQKAHNRACWMAINEQDVRLLAADLAELVRRWDKENAVDTLYDQIAWRANLDEAGIAPNDFTPEKIKEQQQWVESMKPKESE
jgi:hypothetical protein